MAEKRPALGRGLSALIPDPPAVVSPAGERALDVDIDLLRPNPFQPRGSMDCSMACTSDSCSHVVKLYTRAR